MQLVLLPPDPGSAVPLPGPEEEEGRQRAERWVGGVSQWERLPPQHSPELNPRRSLRGVVGHAMLISSIVTPAFSSRVPAVREHFLLSQEFEILPQRTKVPGGTLGRGAWRWDLQGFLRVQVEGRVSVE